MLSFPLMMQLLLCLLLLLTFCRIMWMFSHPRYPLGCHRCGGLNTRLISFQELACRTVLLIGPIRRRLRRFSGKSKTFWTAGIFMKALVLVPFLFFWFLRKMVLGACVLIVELSTTSLFDLAILFLGSLICLMSKVVLLFS